MRRLFFALLLLAFPIAGSSATLNYPHFVTYSLSGSALTGCHVGSREIASGPCPPERTQWLPAIGAFDGKFTLNEQFLGHTLISSFIEIPLPSLGFGRVKPPWGPIVSTTLGIPILDAVGGSFIRLETDSQRRPISWEIAVFAGPPDYGTASGGFSFVEVGGFVMTGPSGVLRLESIAPIPLPPAVALLAVGLLGLGVIGRRKRRSGQPDASAQL